MAERVSLQDRLAFKAKDLHGNCLMIGGDYLVLLVRAGYWVLRQRSCIGQHGSGLKDTGSSEMRDTDLSGSKKYGFPKAEEHGFTMVSVTPP